MRNLYFCSLIALLMIFVSSCTNGDTKTTTNATAERVAPVQAEASGPQIPSVPQELMLKLYDECTYLDYIFHDLPFSMSQDETSSIRANLNYISTTPLGSIPSGCKPIGRQFFHIGGDIVAEANVYFSKECKFYVFVDGETPLYANVMSQEGENFFMTMIKQAFQASGQQAPQ